MNGEFFEGVIRKMSLPPFTTFLVLLGFGSWSYQLTSASQILALFINGHKSHLLVYTSIVNLLIDRGHNVTVVTTEEVKDFSSVSNSLRWIKLSSNYTKSRVLTGSNGFSKIESMLQRIDHTAEFLNDPIWKSFMQKPQHYDLMILGYLFNDYQLGVAAHFECPVVAVWTGQPIGFIHSLMGNPEQRWYVPQPYDRHQFKGLKAIAFGWFEKFVETLALYKMKQIYDEYFTGPRYPSFWELRKNVSLAMCNHHSLSEGPIAPFVPGIIEIGGLEYQRIEQNFLEKSNELESILMSDRKVIYLSFGSRVKWSLLDPDLEMIFVEAFKLFPEHTILWTYDKNCSELQKHASNIKCKSWWPQSAILASNNTKLFITHGGKGSISEVYRYGKPILGIPFFGDQRANVAKMQQRKLGLRLDTYNLTLASLLQALHELLDNEEYRSNVAAFSRLYRDRPLTSEASIVYWLEYVMRYGGARHMRSPSLDLNFIEYYCLDICAIIILTVVALIALCNWLEQRINLQNYPPIKDR